MHPSRIILAISGLSLLWGMGACRSRSCRNTIAIIPRNAAEASSVAEHAGAVEAARRLHVQLYWNGPSSDANVEQQIAIVERAVNRNCTGIVLNPTSTFASNTAIQRALAHRIPVVISGANVPLVPSKNLTFVLDDIRGTGMLTALRLKEILGGRGEIVLLGADPMYAGTVERARAIEDSIRRIAPSIQTVAEPAGVFGFSKTEQDAEEVIKTHPQVSAIVGVNVVATEAAVAAVRATDAAGHIQIVGLDQSLNVFFLLRRGIIDSLVVQNMRAMGAASVSNIVLGRQGKPVPLITRFPAMLVTRSNIDSPSVQNMLMMDWRKRP